MQLTKQERQDSNYLKCGIDEFRVIAINPTKEQLNKLLEKDDKPEDKEIEYLYTKEEKDHVRVTFWVQEVISGWKTKLEFDICNEEASTSKSKNPIWINQVGDNQKVAKENILDWFLHFYKSKDDKTVIGEKNYKRALVGEAELYEFIKTWLNRKTSTGLVMNWWVPTTDIFLDRKKLFRNNMSELTEQLKAPEEENVTGTVVLAAWVDSYEKDGDIKHAQKIWKYKFAPGYMMKKFNLALQTNSWDSSKDTKKYKDDLVGENGIKKGFILQLLKEWNADDHIEASNDAIRHDNQSITDTEY